ncbi:MAG TPA: electron transfer flavoprotein subunit alpha/FixB family protein [Actinomycetota bacterium]|nr:electron transfer flavoprotein subunit alpha/FixB family protein [Actinomycetota bacterium]
MILAFVEHDRGTVEEGSFEALTLGRRLAERLSVPLHALVVGDGARPLAARAAAFGATATHVAVHARLDGYAPEAWAACLADRIGSLGPLAVLAAATDRGNEILAHAAARSGLPMAANCIRVEPGEPGDPADPSTPWTLTRLQWGGSLLEEARLSGGVKLFTVAPHVVAAEPVASPAGHQVLPFEPVLDERDLRARVTATVEAPAGKISLPAARVVVGGGRGVGSAAGFAALEELADLLGGAVGCSRVVTSLAWRPHADQVGQTGTRIAPDLYIACGISGAIQHMVGCKGAKHLLAINTDPDAPIMAKAEYAVIGDVQEVLAALNAALHATARG